MRRLLIAIALLGTNAAYAQVTCQKNGNNTNCTGSLQQNQNPGVINWLNQQQQPNVHGAFYQGQQALDRQGQQQQMEAERTQQEQQQQLFDAQMAAYRQQQAALQQQATPPVQQPAPDEDPMKKFRVAGYMSGARDSDAVDIYLVGAFSAFGFANVMLNLEHKQMLYCAPPNLKMGLENLRQLLDRKIATQDANTDPKMDQTPLEFALLLALRDTFPCQELKAIARKHR